jgi:hypothetical protein
VAVARGKQPYDCRVVVALDFASFVAEAES